MRPTVGITLQAEEAYLELLEPVLYEAEHFEVAPETMWRPLPGGACEPNAFHGRFLRWKEETGRPFLAHGVSFSVGSAAPDPVRRNRLVHQVAHDRRLFDFAWYTDHLGVHELAGEDVILPLPVLMCPESARVIRGALEEMRRAVPVVGLENSAFYFLLGDARDEPGFLRDVLAAPDTHLLLDLHNLHTASCNLGVDPDAYLADLPLEKVLEIHVSGGAESEPAWLPEGRTLRVDSHDHAVPEEVWALLADVLPRCPGLRAVTVERMEGTVTESDVLVLRDELRRARSLVEAAR